MSEEIGGASAAAQAVEPPKMDVKKEAARVAEPITGLSSSQLSAGYWWLSHKLVIRKLALSLLLALDVLLVGYSIFAWGTYAVYGYWKERAMLADMTVSHIPFDKYRAAHAPSPLATDSVQVFDSGTKAGWKDIVVPITNPNANWIANVTYQFADGEEITPEMTATILPGEASYLGTLGYAATTSISAPDLVQKNIAWQRVKVPDAAGYMAARLDFEVGEIKITPPGDIKGVRTTQIVFPITNRSSFSYWSVPLWVLLYSGNTLAGVEQVQVEPFASGETQTIDLRSLTTRFISRAEVKPAVNVFDEGAFKHDE